MLTAALVVGSVVVLGDPAHAARNCKYFKFVKNTPNNSYLSWRRIDPISGYCKLYDSWRSGSGTNTNVCDVGDGWLPNGWYDTWGMYHHYDGSVIHGRTFRMQDKKCHNGTWRTALFIHTEETVDNEQQCSSPYVESQCWDGTSDYYSDGCIKLGPNAGMGGAHSAWHNHGGPSGHGAFTASDRIHVKS
ncbi:MAG: hypothetical protein M3279_11760 [Actinomycetota bacterium]|nr:hypothetical protein [Actinomycetota bacterium]